MVSSLHHCFSHDAHKLGAEKCKQLLHSSREGNLNLLLTAAILFPFILMPLPILMRATSCPLGCSRDPVFLPSPSPTCYYRLVALAITICNMIFCIFILSYMRLSSKTLCLHSLYVFSHKTDSYIFGITMDHSLLYRLKTSVTLNLKQ